MFREASEKGSGAPNRAFSLVFLSCQNTGPNATETLKSPSANGGGGRKMWLGGSEWRCCGEKRSDKNPKRRIWARGESLQLDSWEKSFGAKIAFPSALARSFVGSFVG